MKCKTPYCRKERHTLTGYCLEHLRVNQREYMNKEEWIRNSKKSWEIVIEENNTPWVWEFERHIGDRA